MLHRVGVITYGLLSLLAMLATVDNASAQQVYHIFELNSGGYNAITEKSIGTARWKALAARGYVRGENLFTLGFAANLGQGLQLADRIARLDQTKWNLFWAWDEKAALAAKQVAPSVPVVALFESDPVQMGLVESLARPGGNITGLSLLVPDLIGKRLQLLARLNGRQPWPQRSDWE